MEFAMKKLAIAVLILVALLGTKVAAQDQDGDLLRSLVVSVAQVIADAVAQAVAGTVSEILADSETLAGVGSQVSAGAEAVVEAGSRVRAAAETAAEVGSQVRAGAETLAETRSPVSAITATVTEGVNAAVTETLNEFVAQLRVLIETLVAIVALALASFLAGLLIGIKRVEKLGCGFVIVIGLIAALLAASNLGAGAGIVTAIAVGVVLPFASTALALIAIEAGRRWIALLRSLRASFRNLLNRSDPNDKTPF